jgi:four helix bundle protein
MAESISQPSTLYIDSVGVTADVRVMLAPIARRDQDLARRLRRACDEVPEHIAEGMCLTGRSRRQEYMAALGSAREALACLRAAESVGYLDVDAGLALRLERLLTRISSTLDGAHPS